MANDLFTPPKTSLNDEQNSGNNSEFRPRIKTGKDKFTAVVRFIPHPFDTQNKSIITKYQVYLTNPITNKAMYIDSPSSVGLPDRLTECFFALKNSDNPLKQDAAKHFSRKQKYTSIIQVLQCDDRPEYVGKFLTWTYGIKIRQKIDQEQNPAFGQGHNPFDLLNARPFVVVVVKNGVFDNFDQSYFLDSPSDQFPVCIKSPQVDVNGNAQMIPINMQTVSTPEAREYVAKFLQENCPDTAPYEYQPWTAEIEQFVETSFNAYCNPGYATQQANPQYTQQAPNLAQSTMGQSTPVADLFSNMGTAPMGAGMPQMPTQQPVQQQQQYAQQAQPQMPTQAPQQAYNPFGTTQQPTMPQQPQMPTNAATMPNNGGVTLGVTGSEFASMPTSPLSQPSMPTQAAQQPTDNQTMNDINNIMNTINAQTESKPVNQDAIDNAMNFDDIMGSII